MKKILSIFISIFIISSVFMINVCATSGWHTDATRVVDSADLLTDEQENDLLTAIAAVQQEYNFDVVLLTTTSTEDKTPEAYADDYFDYNGYGYGNNYDGILFLLDMQNRKFHFSTTGYGLTAFTDYGLMKMEDAVIPYMSGGSYYQGFDEFISICDTYLARAVDGNPVDVNSPIRTSSYYFIKYGAVLFISFALALIIVLIMKAKMKNIAPVNFAREYVKKGSFDLTHSRDTYLYSNTTRTARPKSNSSSGGSSSHRSSSGRSHGGRGGSF